MPQIMLKCQDTTEKPNPIPKLFIHIRPGDDGKTLIALSPDPTPLTTRIVFCANTWDGACFSRQFEEQSATSDGLKSLTRIPPRKIFVIEEFNATIEYYWAPFIVESISDHATNHTVLKRLVKLDSVAKHSKEWEGVDILIFESYVWWMHKPQINATYGSEDNIQEYNATTAYRLALETWANWIESSINPKTQKIFFATISPTHLWSWEWKPGSDGNSVFGERKGKLLTKEQRSDPRNYADCIHWCLPGVPDSWNEILYALLLQDYRVPHSSLSEAKTPVP